jgi:outer membrane receptor protein involved in Fe transport
MTCKHTLIGVAVVALGLLVVLIPLPASGQGTGSVSGIVIDGESGETLIGVNVVIAGTTIGATTDVSGRYSLRLDPASYTLVFTYIGFDSRTVENVEVRAGQTTTLDVTLMPDTLGLGEVIVEARAMRNTEASLLRMQARAPTISDGISAQQIRRSPDSNSGDALRRVTGVSIMGGKFAFVRGIPERYNATMLNGTSVASTEPDRRAFAFDMLPANLLENIVVVKSASPNLPGDFSGGLLQLNTVSYPERFSVGFSYANSYTPGVTFEPFVTSERGKWDFLGFDDGTRRLPSSFPTSNLSRLSAAELAALQPDLVEMMSRNWTQQVRTAPVNTSMSVSMGNSARIAGADVGLISALTYRSNYSASGIVRREIEADDMFRFDYSGNQFISAVNWGALVNLSVRPSPNHSISFKNLYSRAADDEVTNLEGNQYEAGFDQYIVGMRYLSRDVYNGQFSGDHFLPFPGSGRGLQLRWDAFMNKTRRDEPDYRRITYNREIGSNEDRFASIFYDVRIGTGGRFFSELDEVGQGLGLHATLPLGGARLMAGGQIEDKDRTFETRLIGAATARRGFDFDILRQPLDVIFSPENFGTNGFRVTESSTGSGSYSAQQALAAGFLMADMPLTAISRRLRLVGGVRFEHSVQGLESVSFSGDSVSVRRPNSDLLPSVNLTFSVAPTSNIRFAYSRNVNRPELRELAPYAYYDFEVQTTIYGNPDLEQAVIQNYDLRLETYPAPGQMLSASVFYKGFRNAIERVVVPGVALNAERTYANADRATNYGFELEARYGLGFMGRYLRESSVNANYTLVRSDVTVEGSGFFLSRTGRPLQGQSPYLVNLGFNLVDPLVGTSVSLLYNRFGRRIVEVATAYKDDIMEEPRDVLDLVITQPINGRFEMRFAARDILGQHQRFTQEGIMIRSNERFSAYTFGFSIRY